MIRRLPLLGLALLVAMCPPVFGFEIKPNVLEKARAELQKAVADGQVVAAAHLVVKDGKPIYHEVVGLNDADDKTPFKADSIVRIYSMSKALTSVAAMTLFDQGKFQLDDPVSKYIPAFEKTTVMETPGRLYQPGVRSPCVTSFVTRLATAMAGSLNIKADLQRKG